MEIYSRGYSNPVYYIIRIFIVSILLNMLCHLPAAAFDVPEEKPKLPTKLENAIKQVDYQRYSVRPESRKFDYGFSPADALQGWGAFEKQYDKQWRTEIDARTNIPLLIEGKGIPFVPGKGNQLKESAFDIKVPHRQKVLNLTEISKVAEVFLAQNKDLLRVEKETLILDEKASKGFGKNNRYWTLRYQHVLPDPDIGPIPVRSAYVFFRINHGNLTQFGNQLATTPQGINTSGIISKQAAIDKALGLLENPSGVKMLDAVRDIGQSDRTLQIVPFNKADGSLGHQLIRTVWIVTDNLSYEFWFDAHSGALVNIINKSHSTDAEVRGGIYPTTNTDAEVLRGLPHLSLINNGVNKSTDASGVYDYDPPGSLSTATLEGDYVRVNDQCGDGSTSISTSLPPGDLSFGMSAGTDCVTPGFGGDGNTHAARSSFYHVNLIKDKARYYLGVDTSDLHWLNNQLESKTNLTGSCNAFWDGIRLKFYQTTATCSNTGEIAGIFLHEFGHGLDANTNGAPPENSSSEAYGDTMAFLQTHDACIGDNFKPGIPCSYGCDATCTGVRDVSVTPAISPATIESAPANCDDWACPYAGYMGPMGYEGHCESLIASGAVWDMIQGFIGRYGDGAGWALGDRIWYESLNATGSAYQLVSGGQCNTAANVDGCGADNWYTIFLGLDDDDGDLTNGTPNADLIWTAFNNHGIACGAAAPPVSTSCPTIAAPALTAAAIPGQVGLTWAAVTDAASYRVYRNEFGCNQGFTPIADVSSPTTLFNDTTVNNGTTYYYSVQAIGADDICVSGFSACLTAIPDTPLQAANIFMVLDQSGSMSGTTDVAGERKIDALQDASTMVLDLVDDYAADGFRVGAVSFSMTVTGNTGLQDPSDTVPGGGRDILDTLINGLTPTSLTAIGLGINDAVAGFPSPDDGKDKVVMLMSDGMQNVSPMLELNSPPPGAGVGGTPLPGDVRFYTVALGTQIQEDLFDDLANQGGIPAFYYSGGTADIQSNFVFWAADVMGLDPSSAPFAAGGGSGFAADSSSASSSASGVDSASFIVNRTARRLTFVLTWQPKGQDLRFYLDTPAGRINPPDSSFHPTQGYAVYTIRFPLNGLDAEAHIGNWIMRVTGTGGASSFQAHALFDDPAISLEYMAGGADPGAGEAIPIEVRILENGNPLTGVTARVLVEGPETGLGELLSSTSSPDPKSHRASITSGDPLPDPATAKLAALLNANPDFLTMLPGNIVVLTEARPGFYQGTIPAHMTEPAGTYILTFGVEGQGQLNASFKRSNLFSRHLRLKPTVGNTRVTANVISQGDLKTIAVLVTPRDKFNNRLGPGWGNYIQATTNAGSFVGNPVDNLDGSYKLELRVPQGSDPKINIAVRGEPVVDGKVNRLLSKRAVSFHVGKTMPRGTFNNNYDSDLSLTLDYEYRYSPQLTAVALLGYNRFDASTTVVSDTYWWNLSANIKYTFAPNIWTPYINGGLGIYVPKSGSSKPGINLGAGLDYTLRADLIFELGVDYHNIFTRGSNTEYLVPHIGLVYRY